MSNEKPVELTEAERKAVFDGLAQMSGRAGATALLCAVEDIKAAARREALLEAADAWDNADPRDLDYLARRFYRAGGPSTPTIWLRRRAEALAEPERDEESAEGSCKPGTCDAPVMCSTDAPCPRNEEGGR